MIAAVLTALLLAVAPPYTEVQLDALYAGSLNPLNGKTTINARRIDLNDDQQADLLLPDRVFFQREGSFFPDESIELPESDQSRSVDVFGDTIYLKFEDSLKAYQYRDETWKLLLDIKIQWPMGASLELREPILPQAPSSTSEEIEDGGEAASLVEESSSMPLVFERFLYDINEDGTPELLFPLQDGLHIYELQKGNYVLLPILNIFPKTKLIPLDEVLPASNVTRGLSFPDQHLVFHCAIDQQRVTLLTKQALNDGRIQFFEYRHDLVKVEDGYKAELNEEPFQIVNVPSFVQPCRLNADAQIDFAGGELDYTSSLALLTPIYTTLVRTSPNRRLQTFRTKSFTPHVIFTDFNQDGYADLVLESTDITNGGLRETLNRFTTQRKFTHRIKVHYQGTNGEFSTSPDVQQTVRIKLDQAPIRLSNMFERYQAGKLINATGDFNRDGLNDLLVQITPDSLALYLCQGKQFSDTPLCTIPIESFETFHVLDVNLDEVADIVLQGRADNETPSASQTRVLLFKGGLR